MTRHLRAHHGLVPAVAIGAVLSAAPLVADAQTNHTTHHSPVAAGAAAGEVPLLDNLGTWTRRIRTGVPLAQKYFDQGLRLYYAFNHAEAVRAFREAQRLDATCVMCFWGEAAALGPNINVPMDSAAESKARVATHRALSLVKAGAAVPLEAALVRAISARYIEGVASSRTARDSAYAARMSDIARRWPRDADVLSLAAEAAMDLAPWQYWDKAGLARPGTARLVGWLEQAMQVAPSHPGACHFYIHAVEAVHPERAVPCAERLAALMPGAGHIVHMPAHIYIRVGRWADAIQTNRHAVHADEQYFDGPHTPDAALYAAAYQSHNHHFLTLAATMAGASELALQSSRAVTRIVTPEIARVVSAVEPLLVVPVQTLVSFGRWQEVLAEPLPPSDLRVAMAHAWYARGMAFAATGRTAEARATIDSIDAVVKALPEGEPRTTLEIARLMVDGELALRAGNAALAISRFTSAAEREDGLAYMEPPTWYHPVRHWLGKALLAAGRPREAEQAYRSDLRRFPENGWALRGLVQSLQAQGRSTEAAEAERRFDKAWRIADVTIPASRF